ncbi:putative nicotinate-nucleotide adenylyltransferase [Desulfosarcina ovata subsp. sediminis]|uniref:Probable nicotinate-nucleotide adenylyltransferase n=1 Tax=Desulfosarcina ovata subsp. sediminis TaxID=885957 RepID=A0A5K7ZWI1_9BACT|nr:nicotinate (nicotinamide) nucleotide adenylyltransferase [Desulfosarcina ovata]BBO84615.1 putative nicotinate-nucleotide adenylyltransferase [Desulfosarcina ovata subsp. sediminis]
MRAGIFGGTFNPIHNGHLMVARQVLQRFSLDRLYIVPCRRPPHKPEASLAPVAHRLEMIRMALPADARYDISDVELQRSGPSYTIDTARHFASRMDAGDALFLVMGLDAFLELHTWKSQRRLLETVQPVVVTRTVDTEGPETAQHRMQAYIRSHLAGTYVYVARHRCWQPAAAGQAIHLLATDPVDVSSSQIRRRVKAGKNIAALVPAAVCAYIEQKGLYR